MLFSYSIFTSMVLAPPSFFPSTSTTVRAAAGQVIFALLSFDASPTTIMPPEAEGGRIRGPPQRDKQKKDKLNLGASLHEQDQLRVPAMLNANSDRFVFSMEDLEPAKFSGEPMRLELTCDKPIFRPPHKLEKCAPLPSTANGSHFERPPLLQMLH